MNKIKEVVAALLSLARLAKTKPDSKAEIEKATRSIAEKLKSARPRDILNICDEITFQGFSSSSDSMDPDGKGGFVWAPERSRAYCDCFFKLADALKYTVLAPERDLLRRVVGQGMNVSVLTSFSRWLKITTPLPNLLSFEGRNETAKLLKPKMPELTEYILSLNNQAKELDGQNRYDDAKMARENSKKLNELFGKMEKNVFPWLERVEKKKLEKVDENKMTLGKALGIEESQLLVIDVIKGAMKEASK